VQTFTGIEYIKIDVANKFGLDRLKWKDRLWWTDDNRSNLTSHSAQAKEPLAFDKAVRALVQAENGESLNHIMGLDATASNIQIMAAMSGCRESAKAVNLIDTGNREDVHESVADEMTKIMDHKIDRNTIKKPLMTHFFGSEAQPRSIFGEGEGYDSFVGAVNNKLPGPAELMHLFQAHWNPMATKYTWAMPDGHVVHIPVSEKVDKGLEIDEANHLRFTYRAEVVRPQQQGKALAANIVHSVDGWMCREMIKRANVQGFYLATIHDCFYAHPNYMNKVRQLYKEVMAEVADMNMVTMILSQISGTYVGYHKLSSGLSQDILESEYALS